MNMDTNTEMRSVLDSQDKGLSSLKKYVDNLNSFFHKFISNPQKFSHYFSFV